MSFVFLSQVAKLVVETVNNVIVNAETTSDSSVDAGSSSAIVQSVETQVSLTLQQEGRISIQQDTVHVEAVTLDPEQAGTGLSFVSLRQSDQGSQPEGTLAGSEVKTFGDTKEIPTDAVVLASARLPGNIMSAINPADSKSTFFSICYHCSIEIILIPE